MASLRLPGGLYNLCKNSRGGIWLHSQLPSARAYGDYQLKIAIKSSILANNHTRSAAECHLKNSQATIVRISFHNTSACRPPTWEHADVLWKRYFDNFVEVFYRSRFADITRLQAWKTRQITQWDPFILPIRNTECGTNPWPLSPKRIPLKTFG